MGFKLPLLKKLRTKKGKERRGRKISRKDNMLI